MENYIVLNGKKAELTEEQLKALGIEIEKKDPFARKYGAGTYHWIASDGTVMTTIDFGDKDMADSKRFNVANYCADKHLIEQQALHETLNRLLWRAGIRAGELENEWDCNNAHWYIYKNIYNAGKNELSVSSVVYFRDLNIAYFPTKESAKNAIETIVKPFIAEHPEFAW